MKEKRLLLILFLFVSQWSAAAFVSASNSANNTCNAKSPGTVLIVKERSNKIHFIDPNSETDAKTFMGDAFKDFNTEYETRRFDYLRDGTFTFFHRPHSCFEWIGPQWLFFAQCPKKIGTGSVCLFKSFVYPNQSNGEEILVAGPIAVNISAIRNVQFESLIIWSEEISNPTNSEYPRMERIIEQFGSGPPSADYFNHFSVPEPSFFNFRVFNYSEDGMKHVASNFFNRFRANCNCPKLLFNGFFHLSWNMNAAYTFYFTPNDWNYLLENSTSDNPHLRILKSSDRCSCGPVFEITGDELFSMPNMATLAVDNDKVYFSKVANGIRAEKLFKDYAIYTANYSAFKGFSEYTSDLQILCKEGLELQNTANGIQYGKRERIEDEATLLLYTPLWQRPWVPEHCKRIGEIYLVKQDQKVAGTLVVNFAFRCPSGCRCPSVEFTLEIGYISCEQKNKTIELDGTAFDSTLTRLVPLDCGIVFNITLTGHQGSLITDVIHKTLETPIEFKTNSKRTVILIVFLSLALLLFLLLLGLFFWKQSKFYKWILHLIPSHQLRIFYETSLGGGKFGEVYKAILNKRENVAGTLSCDFRGLSRVIGKAAEKMKETFIKEKVRVFLEEALIMGNLDHRNILKIRGLVLDSEPRKQVLELMEGSVEDLLKKTGGLTPETSLNISKQVAAACAYLEEKNIVHLDISARNCLYKKRRRGGGLLVKLSDFGLAKQLRPNHPNVFTKTLCRLRCRARAYLAQDTGEFQHFSNTMPQEGNLPLTSAPELLNEPYPEFSSKCDVYLFGSLLLELFSGGYRKPEEVLEMSANGRDDYLKQVPSEIQQLIKDCWELKPEHRPSMQWLCDRLNRIQLDISVVDFPSPVEAVAVSREDMSNHSAPEQNNFRKIPKQKKPKTQNSKLRTSALSYHRPMTIV